MLFWVLQFKCKTIGSFKYHTVKYNASVIFFLNFSMCQMKKKSFTHIFLKNTKLPFTEYRNERIFYIQN